MDGAGADADQGMPGRRDGPGRQREPAFNLPAPVSALALLLLAIHVVQFHLLTEEARVQALMLFSFIPARYVDAGAALPWPAAAFWTPVTYSLLHGSWGHLLMNLAWLVAFATPVARRFGAMRAAILALLATIGGALAHFLAFPGELAPMIGASAIVSGAMGAASRFVFAGPGGFSRTHAPAQKMNAVLVNPAFLSFVGIWFALNYLFGSGLVPIAGEDARIAWQAHVGGFLAGLLGFSLLDRFTSTSSQSH
jgi:membrane associated rhomboid family serine protease